MRRLCKLVKLKACNCLCGLRSLFIMFRAINRDERLFMHVRQFNLLACGVSKARFRRSQCPKGLNNYLSQAASRLLKKMKQNLWAMIFGRVKYLTRSMSKRVKKSSERFFFGQTTLFFTFFVSHKILSIANKSFLRRS